PNTSLVQDGRTERMHPTSLPSRKQDDLRVGEAASAGSIARTEAISLPVIVILGKQPVLAPRRVVQAERAFIAVEQVASAQRPSLQAEECNAIQLEWCVAISKSRLRSQLTGAGGGSNVLSRDTKQGLEFRCKRCCSGTTICRAEIAGEVSSGVVVKRYRIGSRQQRLEVRVEEISHRVGKRFCYGGSPLRRFNLDRVRRAYRLEAITLVRREEEQLVF